MATILDRLADGATNRARLHLVPTGESVTLEHVWRSAVERSRWFTERTDPGDTVAGVFVASVDCLATVIGAWLAGLTVASLPHPDRGDDPASYAAHIHKIALTAQAQMLFPLDGPAFAVEGPIACHAYSETAAGGPGPPPQRCGDFIQFSSGTTGSPKGVKLTAEALAVNVAAIEQACEVGGAVASVSWLPLSHDMGFVGLFLAPWAHCSPAEAGGGDIVLIDTDTFQRSPSIWLKTCSEFRATTTGGPNFAFDLIARRRLDPAALDLSSLRAVCIGAEPVRAETLRRFAEATADVHFDETALCPAYGMAEASLAVTTVRPTEPWRSVRVERMALAHGQWIPSEEDGTELVSVGAPVMETDVRIGGDGVIEVRSGSLSHGYIGGRVMDRTPDGWYRSGDLGHLHEGQLYVLGRTDDLLFAAGRNIHASDIEQHLADVPGLYPRHCALLPDEDGRYLVIAERRAGSRVRETLPAIAREVRAVAARAATVSPSRVIIVKPGSMPRTANGKVQRSKIREAFYREDLAIEYQAAFGHAAIAEARRGQS